MTAAQEDEKAWNLGYAIGRAGLPYSRPPDVSDLLAWLNGYIEGKASREEQRLRVDEPRGCGRLSSARPAASRASFSAA